MRKNEGATFRKAFVFMRRLIRRQQTGEMHILLIKMIHLFKKTTCNFYLIYLILIDQLIKNI